MNIPYKYHSVVNGLSVSVSHLQLEATDEYNGRRRVYRLVKPFRVTMSFDGGFQELVVPMGYKSDLATMPLIAQLLLGPNDAPGVAEAALPHDMACDHGLPASVANSYMLIVMTVFGVPRWKRVLIFTALTLFGYRSPGQRWWNRVKRRIGDACYLSRKRK